LKLISWNVNGIRACVQKGFLEFFHEADADIFCIQETKMQEGQLNLELEGYYQYWNYAVKKGYSGTAVFTKKEPMMEAKIPRAHSAIGIIMPLKPRPADTPRAMEDSLAPE